MRVAASPEAADTGTTRFAMLINGVLEVGSTSMPVLNPATEAVIAFAPKASIEDLDAAVAAARVALPAWRATPFDQRQAVLHAIADRIDAHADELAKILTAEQGKPLRDAMREVRDTAGYFRHFATRADLSLKVLSETDGRRIEAHRLPLGVVGAIVPWNFPLVLMAFKVPAALVAGNTVVLKPAATTPLATLKFGELVNDLLPPGVLNIISDANDLGPAITAHPGIQKISFTGSTETGSRVMASAAKSLKRVSLELGGNDPSIVLEDIDVPATAREIFQHAFGNAGQVCIAVKRVYVHASIYDRFCDELAQLADAAIIGDGMSPDSEFGPIQNRLQYEKILAIIEQARASGQVIAGGHATPGPGFFVRPTIVRDICDGTPLVDDEQFGPIVPIVKFSDIEDVIRRVNDSPFGLGASVWSRKVADAYAVAGRLDVGTVWINTHRQLRGDIPFGGARSSGIGIELGDEGLHEFTQLKVVNLPNS